jgi:hypothetical protein
MCAPAACASGVRFVDFLVLGSYFGRRTFGGWGLVCVAVCDPALMVTTARPQVARQEP